MDNIIRRGFQSNIVGEKVENDEWKVTVSMSETRTVEGEELEEVKLETSCTDKNFESAYQVAMSATLQKFQNAIANENSGSLFKSGEPVEEEKTPPPAISATDLLEEVEKES